MHTQHMPTKLPLHLAVFFGDTQAIVLEVEAVKVLAMILPVVLILPIVATMLLMHILDCHATREIVRLRLIQKINEPILN